MVHAKIDMIGTSYGRLTVVCQVESPRQTDRQAWYLCACRCGGRITVRGTSLRRGQTASCGCLKKEVTARRNAEAAARTYDLKGRHFGALEVLERLDDLRAGSRLWRCRCECGTIHTATTHHLLSGSVKSCGCRPTRTPDDLAGHRFGALTVLELTQERKSNGGAVWRCRCDCGTTLPVSAGNLKRGATVSCGCIRREDLLGRRFGRLTVVALGARSNGGDGAYWLCRCDCGAQTEVLASKLKSGRTASCGCGHNDRISDLRGKVFGKLTVLSDSKKRRSGSGGVLWTCLCRCGQTKDIRQDALTSGATLSCGCTRSRGNEKVARLLREAGIPYLPEYSPPDMPGNRRFDFAVLRGAAVDYLIEYDGSLHTAYTDRGWDTRERFLSTQKSDAEKNAYCAANGIPLIRIPYTAFDRLTVSDLRPATTAYLVSPSSRPV